MSRWRSPAQRARAHLRYGVAGPAPAPSSDTVATVAAMRRLPAEQRVALAPYCLLGLPVADVDWETGLPVGPVKARQTRSSAERELMSH